MKNNKYFLFFVLILVLIASFLISLIFGGSKLSFSELISGLFMNSELEKTIVWQIRIPRIILSIIVGMGLSASGCVLQGILRNPLAEPYTLGISGGAALGATIAVIFGAGLFGLPFFAFLGALLSVCLIYFVASRKYFSATTLILSGVILSFLFSAIVLLIFAISNAEKVHSTLFWLMGDLSSASFGLVKIVGVAVLLGICTLLIFSREIDILTLGEEKASYLGVEPVNTLKIVFLVSSLITGACVSASGIIGFVGLIIPNFMRKFTGPSHSILIPASSLAGAIFLCLADALARSIIYPLELPVGVITGIFGGIFFLSFLLRTDKWAIF